MHQGCYSSIPSTRGVIVPYHPPGVIKYHLTWGLKKPGKLDTWILGYMDTDIKGYRDTGIQGYWDTRILGCRDTGI